MRKNIASVIALLLLVAAIAIVIAKLLSQPGREYQMYRSPGSPLRFVQMQERRWLSAEVRPSQVIRLDKAIERYEHNWHRYSEISRMRKNGVPGPVAFALHGRESGWSFTKHLHNGDPLTGKTYRVPAGRIPGKRPPYTFEESAEDALYEVDRLDMVNWASLGRALQAIETYNGLGYQRHHQDVPSPYLWAGTSIYSRGKYVRDGVFDPYAADKQLGCAAILKRMQERGIVKVKS